MSPDAELRTFLDKYDPHVADLGMAVADKVRPHAPGAVELVYDNYNALVIGFTPERPSQAVFSVAFMPRWASLCFLQDAGTLPDPEGLLMGQGRMARHIKMRDPSEADRPGVQALLRAAAAHAPVPFDASVPRRLVIQSVSARQRPRRP